MQLGLKLRVHLSESHVSTFNYAVRRRKRIALAENMMNLRILRMTLCIIAPDIKQLSDSLQVHELLSTDSFASLTMQRRLATPTCAYSDT